METPLTDPDAFEKVGQNGNGSAYAHKASGRVFAEDTAHCHHYDIYKNRGDFQSNKSAIDTIRYNGYRHGCC